MIDPDTIIQAGGLLAIALVVFAETGLLVGFFLPGDSLLLAAGFFAAKGTFPIEALLVVTFFAATLGYHSGYLIGRKAGPRLFKRKDGIFFRHEYIEKTQVFFETHGGKTILLARFIPIVRTFVSFVAGMGRMDMRQFAFYNILGGMLWVGALCVGGYWLGTSFPDFEKYIKWMLFLFAPLSLAAGLAHVFKHADSRRRLKAAIKEEWNHFFGKR
ncbi:MAG: VTT domain-containing protein [Candidatus Saccharimonadales bacterium]